MNVLVPSLEILLFNWMVDIMKREDFKVLVPSLGILLFNKTFGFSRTRWSVFSSPLWGFFYLIHLMVIWVIFLKFSSPLWGFFYLMKNYKIKTKNKGGFSSPLWGFFYLISIALARDIEKWFSSPLWGFFYLIK